MPAKNNRPLRPYEVEQRKAGFAGARAALADKAKSLQEIADEIGTSRHTITMALSIINHGTPQEIADAESGRVGTRVLWEAIMERVPPAERKGAYRAPTQTEAAVQSRNADADVWQNLRKAIDAILSLPAPKDTAAIARKNPMRLEYANRNLLVALTWITEFSDEITR